MFAYELLPRLVYLTLTVDNDEEYWEERIQFVGDQEHKQLAIKMEVEMYG